MFLHHVVKISLFIIIPIWTCLLTHHVKSAFDVVVIQQMRMIGFLKLSDVDGYFMLVFISVHDSFRKLKQ